MFGEVKLDAVWAHLVYERLQQNRLDADGALASAGLRKVDILKSGHWISVDQNDRMIKFAAREFDDDCFGLKFGSTVDPRDIGLLAYIGLNSRTLGEAIENMSRYLSVHTDVSRIELDTEDGVLEMHVKSVMPMLDFRGQPSEAALAFMVHLYRSATGRDIRPVEIHFRHARPRNQDAFRRYFGCPVHFSSEHYGIAFKTSDLGIRLLNTDDRLLRILQDYCEDILARRNRNAPDLVGDVERHIIELMPKGKAKAKIVANEMGMSDRTFSRRLAQFDTSFPKLLDAIRHDLAIKYLTDTELGVMQIAFLLGYTNPSSFNQSFKKWTGKSPRSARGMTSSLSRPIRSKIATLEHISMMGWIFVAAQIRNAAAISPRAR